MVKRRHQEAEETLKDSSERDQTSSESSFNPSFLQTELDKTGRGRPKTRVNFFLDSFIKVNNNSFKIDNLRTKILRSYKKSIRVILRHLKKMGPKHIIPDQKLFMHSQRERSILHQIDITKPSDVEKWKTLAKYIAKSKKYFQGKCSTADEPRNENRAKHRSFNKNYCKEFFSDKKMKESSELYLDLVFNDRSPNDYVTRFNMKCCECFHDEDCYSMWEALKEYIRSILY